MAVTISKVWDFFEQSTQWFKVNLYETVHDQKDFTLDQINFLPRYVQEHLKNDFYTKMFAQLYPDPEVSATENAKEQSLTDKIVGGLSNAAGSAVNRVTNAVANQITATGNYARNLVNTLTFGLVGGQSAAGSGDNMPMAVLRRHIPHLKVTEVRINDKLTQKGIFIDCLKKLGKSGWDLATGDAGWGSIKDKIAKGFDEGLKNVVNKLLHMDVGKWLDKMKSGKMDDAMSTRIGGLAYAFIRNAASGAYMNTYELPYFGADRTFLKSIGSEGFQHSSTENDLLKTINNAIGGSLAVNENVSWQVGQFKGGTWQGSFTLFNDTLDMYANNLDLVLRLVMHSTPIRDSFMYRPPCCYDVTEVGARRCYFCSGDFAVKKVGKIRCLKWANDLAKGNHKWSAVDLISQIKERLSDVFSVIGGINEDIINYVPDAFEVSYTFSPIISENYNTLVYYFLQGTDGNPNRCVLPAYGKDDNGKELRATTSLKYGSSLNTISDELMSTFTNAFVNAL